MKRVSFLFYGIIAYLAAFTSLVYAIGFIGNLVVPKTIDRLPQVPLINAILINASLLSIFALQHSIMARPGFKRWFTRIIPEELERSTYVLMSGLLLTLIMWQWQPMGGVVWSVDNSIAKTVLLVIYFIGWTILFLSSFLINHFDLFGLRQVWLYFQGKPYTHLKFRLPFLYKVVRHPIYFGMMLAFWSTSIMTISHLFFAILATGYVLVGIQLEERDLIKQFGEKYNQYKKRAPMLIPFTKKKTAG